MPMEQPQPDPPPPETPPVLPEPGPKPGVPAEFRFPFHGKMEPPTTMMKTREEREAERNASQKKKRLRGFLLGLLVGQLLVIALDLGGAAALHFFKHKIRVNAPIPFEALVFVGMSTGILATALLILAVLGLQGAGWVFGKKKVGFFTAVGRGLKRVVKAAWALGLTIGVVAGTAWLMIPGSEWSRTGAYFKEKGLETGERAKTWIKGFLTPRKQD
jgi:hypothetical protein